MGYAQNSLTGSIYEMALGRADWDSILDLLAASFPGCLVLVSGDDTAARRNLVFAQRGLSPAAAATYVNTYAGLNPWLDGLASFPLHQVYHDNTIVPRETAAQSEFGQWLAGAGDFAAGTGVVVLRRGARQFSIEIRYPGADDTGLRERAATVLGEAAAHLKRAFEIESRERLSTRPGYLDAVVEELPFAMFLVGEDMRIEYANFHADSMRRQNHGDFAVSDGYLRAGDPQADMALRQMVQKTLGARRSPAMVLPIRGVGSSERYFAVARSTAQTGRHYQLHDAILDPGPLAMLAIHGSLDASALPLDLLWRAFSLTEAEALLAEALLNGATVADYAMERAVSKQTLRNQLMGVMRKTGTRRQSELLSLLTRLALTCA
jgi:DNA-binding CsgD family transcriptional regulator